MIPLGLAELTTAPLVVGARLKARSAGELVLADALCTLQARDETGASGSAKLASDCRSGDFVAATVALDPVAGAAYCTELRLLGRGQPEAATRSVEGLRQRQAAEEALRTYFRGERFLELHTPTFGTCPGLDPYVHSLGTAVGLRGTEHSMTSPEFYMKRALAAGVPRCFQLATVFRAEELGPWHEPEFTLLEWYRAYEGIESVMSDTERLVGLVGDALRDAGGIRSPRQLELTVPFARITVRDAFRKYADIADSHDYAAADPAGYFQAFVDRVEPALAALPCPVFLTEFPASQAALARLSTHDPTVALRFELMLGGVEICNGYDELTDATEQRARFESELARRRAAREPVYPLDDRFLAALDAGMPPASGNALGLERLLAVLSGAPGIEPFYAFSAKDH